MQTNLSSATIAQLVAPSHVVPLVLSRRSSELLDSLLVEGPLRPWRRLKLSKDRNSNPINLGLALTSGGCLKLFLHGYFLPSSRRSMCHYAHAAQPFQSLRVLHNPF